MADDVDDEGQDIQPGDLDDLGDLEDGDEPDDGAGKDDEPDEDDWNGEKPPTPAQWRRAQRRLAKLTKGSKEDGADVDRKLARQLNGGKDAEDGADGDDAEARRWRVVAATQSAAAELSAAGFNGTKEQAARLARLLDVEKAKPTQDGVFDFSDDVEDLKDDYPELFGGRGARRNERGRAPAAGNRGDRNGSGRPAKTATDKTSEALLKGAGYM